MRSLLPSTTRTWTLRVSPGANSGRSSLRLDWSTRSVGCMGFSGSVSAARLGRGGRWDVRGWARTPSGVELGQQRPLVGRQPASGVDEVGPANDGPAQGLGPAPAVHLGVVARAQDR